jgi:DNA-binding NarL/FixJ family response regulator
MANLEHMNPPTRLKRTILVVENEDFLRSLIADSLEKAGFNVATAANSLDAKRLISSVDPDALILDIDLGHGPTGLDLAAQLSMTSPEVGIVFLTDLPDPRFSRENHEVKKNQAYLNKKLLGDSVVLVEAIEAVLLETGIDDFRHDKLDGRPLANLSRTQLEILKLLSEGKTNQQIADARGRSLSATESAVTRTLEELDIPKDADMEAKGFTQLTVYGYSDQTGTKATNDKISLARATAIYSYLKVLLAEKQLTVTLIGKGFKDPVASNDTADGRAANRRAVVSVG